MNDATQDPQDRGGSDAEAVAAVSTAEQAGDQAQGGSGDWSDAASDPGSGVPGGGRHKYASGKTYCGTEN
jgi:hypothetical protein